LFTKQLKYSLLDPANKTTTNFELSTFVPNKHVTVKDSSAKHFDDHFAFSDVIKRH